MTMHSVTPTNQFHSSRRPPPNGRHEARRRSDGDDEQEVKNRVISKAP